MHPHEIRPYNGDDTEDDLSIWMASRTKINQKLTPMKSILVIKQIDPRLKLQHIFTLVCAIIPTRCVSNVKYVLLLTTIQPLHIPPTLAFQRGN